MPCLVCSYKLGESLNLAHIYLVLREKYSFPQYYYLTF
nr:MAG TPA: hypothetical protein [Caudoviricetes sp.]